MSLIRPYVSKSSIETYQMCGLRYMINYSLGLRDPGRKKTILGTITHSICEVLASIKKEIQSGKKEGVVKHEDIGEIIWDEISFKLPSILTDDEIKAINKTRVNKQTYKSECQLKKGTIRYGREFLSKLIDKAWKVYTEKTKEEIAFWNQEWENIDKVMLVNYVYLILENLDIRNLWIIDIEKEFDLPLENDECKLPTGEYIRIKGFIDLVYKEKEDSEVICYVDFKSGERKSFNSGEEKTLTDLAEDLQLTLYNKVMKIIYPNYQFVMGGILFLRDGGLFNPYFADDSDEVITKTIHEHIQELKNCTELKVLSEKRDDFRCKYLCKHSKATDFHSTTCNCEIIKQSVRTIGLEETTKKYKKETFNV